MKLLRQMLCASAACLALLMGCAVAADVLATPTQEAKRDGRRTWIERPWEIRYFLHFEDADSWSSGRDRAKRDNAKASTTYFRWKEFFDLSTTLTAKDSEVYGEQKFAVVSVEFDKQGFVTTANSHPAPLRGRLNQLRYLTLSAGEAPSDRVYPLSIWFTGIGDASTDWAPGFCYTNQQPDAAQVKSSSYLYGSLYEVDESRATFGCREWAYQLYNDERPYIDVTSYVREGKVYPKYTYIRDFIGWARFGDKKPVIGKHEKEWYCLHDCPAGDKPGLIPDIKVWATKNGWTVPKPPTKAPTFVDPPARAGTYPN
jgi:hypothetical protein